MDVIIVPDESNTKEIVRQLLELADSPYDVVWVQWPKAGFRVPAELAEKLSQLRVSNKLEELADQAPDGEAATQAPRRRGRPRKTVETVDTVLSTDDTEKEE